MEVDIILAMSLVFGEAEGEEDVEDCVDDVGGQVVDEEAEDAVVEHAVLEGAVWRPREKRGYFS